MSDIRIPIRSLNRSKSIDVEQMDNPIDIGLDPGTIVRVHKDLMGREEPNQHPITSISNLASTLDDLSQTDQQLRNDLNQEITDRQNGDNTLQRNIEDETLARVQADNQLQVNIDNEARDRRQADNELQQNINNEIDARESADRILQQNLNDEIRDRQNTDNQLQRNIDNEVNARQQADNNLQNSITSIQNVIPAEATPSNQLADKAYVINNIQTFGASYRGSWATWADVPTNPNLYPEDALGSRTPDKNDYMIVTADETQDGGTWKYVYTGVWSVNGKSGWHAEYEIEKSPFTPEQQAAIDSGITSTKVAQIETNKVNIENINTTLNGYGNIVTHNVNEFATAEQGAKADTAVQPEDIGNGTITFIQGDETKGTITVNQKGDTTIYLDKGGDDLFNIDGGKANSIYIPDVQLISGGKAAAA